MIYQYLTTRQVFKKNGCKHLVGSDEVYEDLIITYWTPLNFKAPQKNFILRKDHYLWDAMHTVEENRAKKAWLETYFELDPEYHKIDMISSELTTQGLVNSFKIYEHKILDKYVFANTKWDELDSETDEDTGVFQI